MEQAAKLIVKNLNEEIEPKVEYVGNLGEKGKLFCKTILKVQNGNIHDSTYKHLDSTSKNPQRFVTQKIQELNEDIYTENLFTKIDELNTIENGESVTSLENLIFSYSFNSSYQYAEGTLKISQIISLLHFFISSISL